MSEFTLKREFPRTEVDGISLPRMLIGSNWFCGYSHRSVAQDRRICEMFDNKEAFLPVLKAYLENGVDAVMGLFSKHPAMLEGVREAEQRFGRHIHIIDTPIVNVDNNRDARAEAEATIRQSASFGAEFCLIHHSSAEQLVNKNTQTIDRLDDYTKMIRDAGMIPGLSAHMPELVLYSDANGYDIRTYIQIYNCMGFLMQVEIEQVARVINTAHRPVMTIKPFAAGRVTPYVGLNFVYNTIRDSDMVTIGVQSAAEAEEDIEIGFAALERRYPGMATRTSPAQQSALGNRDIPRRYGE